MIPLRFSSQILFAFFKHPPPEPLPLDRMKKRATYRANYRGSRENNYLISKFCSAKVDHMDTETLAHFETLLEEEDPDLFEWISGQSEPPSHVDENPVFQQMVEFSHHLFDNPPKTSPLDNN